MKDFTGFNVSISLPSVIIGAGHQVAQSPKASPQVVFPCQSPFGPFEVEVALLVENAVQAKPEAVGAAS